MTELVAQLINLFAAILLMLSFAMIAQRRILSLIHLFTAQGITLVAATVLVGYATHQPHLYVSAGITLALKVILIPWLLYRAINRLDVRRDVETLINIPMTMLIGIALVIFAFNLALPISKLSVSVARGTLGIALACVLLSFMMMITRSEGGAAGDRFPVDGKRPLLRRHQRRPTACRWSSNSASRSTCWSAS
jgi:hydrogenase-4 component E